MGLTRDLRELIECFNAAKVECLEVGALAARKAFGFGTLDIRLDDLTRPASVIQLGNEPHRVDLMTSISGVAFEEAWTGPVARDLDGLLVHYLGLDALMRNQIDLQALRDLHNPEDS
jgi:hypothetical protein